jgi:hypothetical protein
MMFVTDANGGLKRVGVVAYIGMMPLRTRIAMFALLLLGGCGQETPNDLPPQAERELRELPAAAKAALETAVHADELVLYSLNPHIGFGQRGKKVEGAFHGWPILGEVPIVRRADRERLWQALARGIGEKADPATCFDPRHGVRATLPDGTAMDWVICFECHELHVRHGEDFVSFTTSGSPTRYFNEVLRNAEIGIAP